jgi:hypothetical protein
MFWFLWLIWKGLKRITLILLVFAPVFGWAQSDSLRLPADTLTAGVNAKIDSLHDRFTAKSDSIKQSYATRKEKISGLKQRYLAKADSVKKINLARPDFPASPLDTLKRPELNAYTKKIDSLDQQLANLEGQTMKGIDSLKSRITRQLDKMKLPEEMQGKATKLTSAMDNVSVPSFDSDISGKLGLDKLNTGLPDIPGTGNLPDANLPNTNLPNVSTNLPGIDVKAPDLNGKLPSTDINTGKLNDITGQAGDIQKQVQDATGSQEGLSKTLEAKAAEQVKGLPDQKLPDMGVPGGVPQTSEAAQQQAIDMAKKEAVNHFAGKEQVLMGAMEKMSKYKQKYSSVSSLKDIENQKRYNELKGKPLRERLVPALTLQFQSWRDFMLDFNPSVAYRFTTRFKAGLGWNQRVAFNIQQRTYNDNGRVFGIRSYGEYELKKGFGIRLDVESMYTPEKHRNPVSDYVAERDWVWGALIGIKQKYPIYKKLMGNAQLMYNIFDKDHRSPYTDRVNFRIGLEFTLKKKKQSKKPVEVL